MEILGDLKIRQWKLEGCLSIWKNKNESKWNLTADFQACDSICIVIDTMLSYPYFSKKSMPLTVLKTNPDWCGKKKSTTYEKLTIKLDRELKNEAWMFLEKDFMLSISLNERMLLKLKEAISGIKKNEVDYCIGETPQLWVW